MAIQGGGKLVAVGIADAGWDSVSTLAIAQYRPDGTLDPTFSGNEKLWGANAGRAMTVPLLGPFTLA